MAVKLHRCPSIWLKIEAHPCWRVQKALDESGPEYEVVAHSHRRGKRDDVEEKTGQRALPAIELEDGRWIREDSKDLAARVREGRFQA